MAFDQNKYKAIFENRYGKGSYNAGLSKARSIGSTAGRAEVAKEEYKRKLKEAQDAAKNKTYDDALAYWNEPENNAALRRDGASRNAENIRNDPRLKASIQEQGFKVDDYIDAMYHAASNGQFRSEREFKGYSDKLKKEAENTPPWQSSLTPKVAPKENKKKGAASTLDKIGAFIKSKDKDGDGERDGLLGLIDRYVTPISKGATDALITGNTERMAQNDPDNPVVKAAQKDRGLETKVLNAAGMIGAFAAPYSQAYKAADFAVNKVPSLARIANPYAKKAVIGATAGGMAEAGISATNELANSEANDMRDYALRTGLGIAGGAILDPALYGIANIIKRGRNIRPGEAQPSDEILALPEPKQMLPEPVKGLPAPQLKLPAPNGVKASLETLRGAFKQPGRLENPIPEMPDIMRIAANRGKFEQAGVNFAQNTKNLPKARFDRTPLESSIDPMNRGQAYWQGRYEDFAKQVNARHDLNNLTPEALEDLWSSFARYDEPVKLDQVVDLAYPRGFEAPQTPKAEPTPEPPARTLKDELQDDPRINELVQNFHPPTKPISRKATLDEMFKYMEELAPPKKAEPSLEPLLFKRQQGSLEKLQKKNLQNLLPEINKNTASRTVEPPSLNRLKALRDYEPIESARNSFLPLVRNESAAAAERTSSIGEGLERLRNLNQDPEKLTTSFRSKVDRDPKGTNKFKEGFSNLRTQFVDDLAPLERLEKNIRGTVASAEDSLYKQGRLFRGSSEKANQIVETRLNPILDSVKKVGFTAKDLGDYALAIHARDVNAKGIKSGFTNAEVDAVIKKFSIPEMEEARKSLMKLNNDLLDTLSDSGVMSKESVEQLRKKHPNYMPLFRSFDDDKVDFALGLQKTLGNVANPIKKLEGSDRNVIDPLESVVKNIFKLTNAADRNKVAGQLGKLAAEDTENVLIRPLNPGEEVGRKNVVSAWEKGKKVQYEVPPEVYKSLMDLDRESSNFLIKVLQKPAGTLRAGATLTPEFSLRNPMRDVLQAFVVSKSGFNPITDFSVGLFQSALKGRSIKIAGKEIKAPDQLYRQFIEENGGLGNIVSVDRDLHRKAIQDAFKSKDKRFINVVNPKAWVGVLRAIADVSETSTKVGEYRAALRSGASRQEAAYRARDIMDFARAGVSVREANKVVAFLNANIQGKSKLLRAIKENPVKVGMKSLTSITLPTVGVFMAQKYLASDEQKKLINDSPSWLKNTFWLVPVPGTEQVARIPKPFDLAPLFANLPERTMEYLDKNAPEAFDNFAREAFSSYAIPTMLTGLVPLVEGMANYSFFRDAPIIPQREKNLNYPDQHDINTSETAKAIGKGVDQLTGGSGTFKNFGSPRVVENTIRGLTGGLGTYATDIIDLIVEGSGLVDEVEKPEKDFLTEQSPLRAFLVNKSSTGQSVDKLYTLKDRLSKGRGSANAAGVEYDQESQYDLVNEATKEIGKISKEMRAIENAPNLSGQEKRQLMDQYNRYRNDLAYEVMQMLQEQK